MFELHVAKELGMTLAQLRASCTRDDLVLWSAYFQVIEEDREKVRADAEAKAGRAPSRRRR